MTPEFSSQAARDAFAAFPPSAQDTLLALRRMIYDLAADLPVGPIEETTKWGQPSYATPKTKAATPIRLGVAKSGEAALFTHCQTRVMSDFQAIAPRTLEFDGNRAVHIPAGQSVNLDELAPLIRAALTYHL